MILFAIFFISCSTTKRIEAIKPLETDSLPASYEIKTSFISVPTEINLKDIEKILNNNLSGLIYEDNELEKDNTEMKIWKTASISLTEKNGEIVSEIPLKIWAKIKYGTEFLGLNDTREINLKGKITLSSKPHLYNWQLTTKSRITAVQWEESPNLIIAGKKIPITYLINPTLSIFKNTISKMIDDSIEESCDFKPMVLEAMKKISQPILTHNEYEVWFQLIPIELYVTEAALTEQSIQMNMGLKCNMMTMIGEQPTNEFSPSNLVLKPVTSIPNHFSLALAAVSTYESASKVITKNFQNQEFGSGSRKVIVKKVSIWQNSGKLIIALDLTGTVTGTIYLSGIPKYDGITKEIYFDHMDYILNTKNVLLKSANWLAQGTILKKIQENCRYSIEENLKDGEKTMKEYLTNYSPMKGVYINGIVNTLEFEKIELTEKAIIAYINSNGNMKINIDGME